MVRTITITETMYNDLIRVKAEDESFSDLFGRLIKFAIPVEVIKKIRGNVEFKNKHKMALALYSNRETK